MFKEMNDLEIMARTIYGEARGEFNKVHGGIAALIAVGNVIFNRFKEKRFGKTIQDVCLKPWQFSCWNEGDSNRKIIESVQVGDSVFDICCEVASAIVDGRYPDVTKGSNHYFSKLMKSVPSWAQGVKPRAVIGDHIFFVLKG